MTDQVKAEQSYTSVIKDENNSVKVLGKIFILRPVIILVHPVTQILTLEHS